MKTDIRAPSAAQLAAWDRLWARLLRPPDETEGPATVGAVTSPMQGSATPNLQRDSSTSVQHQAGGAQAVTPW
jgi:hypothetical protein